MKLKKIASLMLAGVMAVSMLAGCSNGTKPDDGEKDPVVDSSLTGKVIAALDEDTTKNVTFTSSSTLDAAVNVYLSKYGSEGVKSINAGSLHYINDDISDETNFTWYNNTNNKDSSEKAGKEAKMTVVVNANVQAGVSEEYAIKTIAKAIDDDKIFEELQTDSVTFKVDTDGDGKTEEFWYNYDYNGNLSVIKVEDAVSGVVSYVAVYTITRTAEKDAK